MVPNRPSCSPFGPAVKKTVLGPKLALPVVSLPTRKLHNPSMTIACPWRLLILLTNLPLVGLYALMWPSPKFPMNKALKRLTGKIEGVDDSVPLSCDIVVFCLILNGISHDQLRSRSGACWRTNRDDVERRIAPRQVGIGK